MKENGIPNLMMIGTPNAGSPIAQSSNICEQALEALKPGAADAKVGMNPNKGTSTVLYIHPTAIQTYKTQKISASKTCAGWKAVE